MVKVAKKVKFAGVVATAQSVKTWPRSGFRRPKAPVRKAKANSSVVLALESKKSQTTEIENRDDPDSESTITRIFYGSLNISTLDREVLLHDILTSLECIVQGTKKTKETSSDRDQSDSGAQANIHEENASPSGKRIETPLEIWMVLNLLLRSDTMDSLDCDQAEFILTQAKSQFLYSRDCQDILELRVVIQCLRVVDILLSIADIEQHADPVLVHTFLTFCVQILQDQQSSKALVGTAIHVINHLFDLQSHLEANLTQQLVKSLNVPRPFSVGSISCEFLSTYLSLLQCERDVMVENAAEWIPTVVRGLVASSPHVRASSLAVLNECLRRGSCEKTLSVAIEVTLNTSVPSFAASGTGSTHDSSGGPQVGEEPLAHIFIRRLMSLLSSNDEVVSIMDIWSGLLLAVYAPNGIADNRDNWVHLNKWLEVAKIGLQNPLAAIREASLHAWRTVIYIFAFNKQSTETSPNAHRGVQGLLLPFRAVSHSDESMVRAYWKLFYTLVYVASQSFDTNSGTIWDSMLAPVTRMFFEHPSKQVRTDTILFVGQLLNGSLPYMSGIISSRPLSMQPGSLNASHSPQSSAPWTRVRVLGHDLELEELRPLPLSWTRNNTPRIMKFLETIVEDCNLTSSEIFMLWTSVLGVTRRALAAELQESESSLARIAELTAFIQTNKTVRQQSPQLAAITLENLGITSLSPVRMKQVIRKDGPAIALAEKGAGTTSALSALTVIIIKSQREPISGNGGALETLLAYAKNSRETIMVVKCMFEAAASSSEETWQACAEMLLQMLEYTIDSEGCSVIVDALTAALALETPPTQGKTWNLWAALFSRVVPLEPEESLLNILDRVPGDAGVSLLPLKAGVLKDRYGFDQALLRIAVDGSLMDVAAVVDSIIALPDKSPVPSLFSNNLARLLIVRNSTLVDVDYKKMILGAIKLYGDRKSGNFADAILTAISSATQVNRQICVEVWNKYVFEDSALTMLSESTLTRAENLKRNLCGGLKIPAASGNHRRIEEVIGEPGRGAGSDFDSPVWKKRRTGSFNNDHSRTDQRSVISEEESKIPSSGNDADDYGVLSPPNSSETGDEVIDGQKRPTPVKTLPISVANFEAVSDSDDDVAYDSDYLCSSPPSSIENSSKSTGDRLGQNINVTPSRQAKCPPSSADMERLRTIKRSLIGLNVKDALTGLKRSECRMIHNLLFDYLVEMRVHLHKPEEVDETPK